MLAGSTRGSENIILALPGSSDQLEAGGGGGGGAISRVDSGLTSGLTSGLSSDWRGGADLGTTQGNINTNNTWGEGGITLGLSLG